MRIAYLYDAVYPWVKGGAERRIYELSRRLAARGHDVHCYGMKWWSGDREIVRDGVRLHGICSPVPLYSGGRRSISQAAYFAAKALTIGGEYDLLDCQNFPYLPCISARLLCSLRRRRLYITWHEVWGGYWCEYLGRAGPAGMAVERSVARLTSRNIAVSERTRRDLLDLGAGDVSLVPNGIDLQAVHRAAPSERESDVIYVGRLLRHKNVDLLVEAVSLLRGDDPGIRALIVGDGPLAGELKSLVHSRGLEGNVELLGFQESYGDLLSLLKSSRVFVSPSTREGFGMAALEALACGLPVVTVEHRQNAVCDLVRQGTGILCGRSAEQMARAIDLALQRAKGMRGRCQEQARRYDWERICDLAEEVYTPRSAGWHARIL
ncbi:MAG: glycosyltransferase family 4 protein [Methanothrix sp.]|nr:glycosyltransferase family 4 protein [Methanothrix sp.]